MSSLPSEEQQQPSLVPRPTGLGVDLRGTVLTNEPFELAENTIQRTQHEQKQPN